MFFWALEQGPEALRLVPRHRRGLPARLGAQIADAERAAGAVRPRRAPLRPGLSRSSLVGFGDTPDEHAAVVAPVRETLPPLFDMVTPMPYVALQQMLDDGIAWGFHVLRHGPYVEDLSDEAIDVLTEHCRARVRRCPRS